MSGPQYSAAEMLARLVSFDTTSHKSNMELVHFVKDYLGAHGVECHLVPAPDEDKASLYATIGPGDSDGGIGLSGHTDVVPVLGQSWDTDPFTMVSRDDKYFGRGTCDMKGFLACVLASVPDFRSRRLKTPLHILFSYDEEVGCTGVRPMIDQFGSRLVRPRIVIVGEPTNMTVVDAHKGPLRYEVTITGRSAHSSMAHLGANPVMAAGRLIAKLCTLEEQLKKAETDDRFAPPYSTIQINTVEGGFGQNVIPSTCTFSIDIRVMPGASIDDVIAEITTYANQEVLPDLRAVAPEATIEIVKTNEVPAFLAGEDSTATPLALQLAGQNETFAVSYATEAGWFQLGGSSTIICGPGDIAQAHTANEFLEHKQLEQCMGFMTRLADWAED